MCDSYIGLDQEYTIDLLKVNQIIERNAATIQSTKKNKAGKINGGLSDVVVDAQPKQAAMIKTGQEAFDQDSKAVEMPMQFQLYSELTSKVYGTENRQQMELIAADGEGREASTDSNNSFEFDVAADDIYDLTFF